jgi:hypothetical protein
MKIRILAITLMLAAVTATSAKRPTLIHVKGMQSVGIRGGIGTKNKYDVGLTYNYSFDQKYTLISELDHEEATFGYSDFTNVFLYSVGADYAVWQPTNWCYLNLGLGACVGYDKWHADIVDDTQEGWVYGAQAGMNVEVFPWPFLSFDLKAQQYLLFGNKDQYLKPNFSIGIRYNFHI